MVSSMRSGISENEDVLVRTVGTDLYLAIWIGIKVVLDQRYGSGWK